MSNDQFQQEAEAWRWLQANMPIEVNEALTKFVSINPHWRGAEWWDVLSVLLDSDSHLDITEPMSDVMDEWSMLHSFITYTLLYASKAFAVDYTDAMRVDAVRATIDNNGGSS